MNQNVGLTIRHCHLVPLDLYTEKLRVVGTISTDMRLVCVDSAMNNRKTKFDGTTVEI